MWKKVVNRTTISAFSALSASLYFSKRLELQQRNVPIDFQATFRKNDDDIPTFQCHQSEKKHLVILGCGWGSVGLLQHLKPDNYQITVISPTNYFLFTPLLPSSTIGTVASSSLTESIRTILRKYRHTRSNSDSNASYLQAEAVDLDIVERRVKCQTADGKDFWVEYDQLVIAVGARSVTFGVPGVAAYCHFLKTIDDAKKIKETVVNNLEKAMLPTTSDEERARLLSFIVCGGGPTGVEFAAELYDYLKEDVFKHFPSVDKNTVKIQLIQSSDHILNTYDLKISQLAEENFKRSGVNVITKSRVTGVHPKHVEIMDKTGNNVSIPYGLCVWTTGIGMHAFTEKLASKLGQDHYRALIVDDYLKVKGIKDGCVFAVGDCSTIDTPKLVEQMLQIFQAADVDQNGSLSYEEFLNLSDYLRRKFPQTAVYLNKARSMFQEYDKDNNGSLNFVEFEAILTDLDRRLRPLPATAQVAQQQGRYIADYLNYLATQEAEEGDLKEDGQFRPFRYFHLGSLAYLGSDVAALDFGKGWSFGGKFLSLWLWRSVYLSEQVSLRQRVDLALDWVRTFVFGRDITKS